MTLNCEQVVKIVCQGITLTDKITLVEKRGRGVPANHQNIEDRSLDVDLQSIKYDVPQKHKKKGHEKPISIEDAFLMS